MRILLISPAKLDGLKDGKGTIPVPLLHLAAVLRQHGHEPHILDLSLIAQDDSDEPHRPHFELVLSKVDELNPDMVGINCFTTLHFTMVLKIAETVRDVRPDMPIATGGAHPSLFPKEILENSLAFDYIAVGEAEESFVELVNAVESGNLEALNLIQSIAFRREGEVVVTPRRNYFADLDDLPEPAWDMIHLPDYYNDLSSWYNPKGLDFHLSVPILSSRSCPFTCNFCAIYTTMGRKLRLRSPGRVVDEIEMLHKERGQNYFGFIDDNVNIDKRHILAICNEIVRRNLNIQWETTCGTYLAALNDEVIEAMGSAGCVFVRLPIEHGNDELRTLVGKKLPRDKIYSVAESLKKHGMFTSSMFIMGFPEDTVATLEDTRQMIEGLGLDLNYVFNIIPFPGTRVFQQAQKDGLFLDAFRPEDLWRGDINLDPVQDEARFFIKPYDMTLDQLRHYRKVFDGMRVNSDKAKYLNKAN
jgi:anaerobic magnesium-protoporphyrin IX monomethyl ester cyclase